MINIKFVVNNDYDDYFKPIITRNQQDHRERNTNHVIVN